MNPVNSEEQLVRLAPFFPPHLLEAVCAESDDLSANALQLLTGTVMVVDMKGFSAGSARIFEQTDRGDMPLLELIEAFFAVVLGEAERFGGSPVTFDGDALTVLFHGPCHEDTAVRAAISITNALGRTTAALPNGENTLQASIGVSTGALFSASVPMFHCRAFLVLGACSTQAVQAQKHLGGAGIILTKEVLARVGWKADPVGAELYRLCLTPGMDVAPPPETARASLLLPLEAGRSPQVAAFLRSHFPVLVCQQILSDAIQVKQRPMAALFVNVDGLSTLTLDKGLDAFQDLSGFFEGVGRIIEPYGGLLNKINAYSTGDKYLILFGVSALRGGDVGQAALEVALALQNWANIQPFPLRQRIGLGGGPASECLIGNSWRREFTAIGKPVNEAVHLMEQANWGEIAVLRDVPQVPTAWAVCQQQIFLKGYTTEMPLFRISRRHS